MTRPSIVFVEQFYYPEGWAGAQLPRDITTHFALIGYSIKVVCGSDQYSRVSSSETVRDPRLDGVIIERIPRLFPGDLHRLKLLRQVVFYLIAIPVLLLRRSPSLFMTQTNPPLIVPLVAMIAAVHRRPFVVIAQDIYPDVLFANGSLRRDQVAGRFLDWIFRWAFLRAARVVTLGGVMRARLLQKKVCPSKIHVISNWATGDESVVRGTDNPLREQWNLQNAFVILYSGNVGIAHDVETIIAAMQLLRERAARAVLLFIGKGSRLEVAKNAVRKAGLESTVQFRALVPTWQLPMTIGLAKIALVTLRPGFEGLVVPSKLFGYMARAVPTLYVGPKSDVETILRQANAGLCYRNEDAQGLANGILELMKFPDRLEAMGRSASMYYGQNLAREHGLAKYEALVHQVFQALA